MSNQAGATPPWRLFSRSGIRGIAPALSPIRLPVSLKTKPLKPKENTMSIIRKPAAPAKIVMFEAHVPEPLIETLQAYCRFVETTSDHIITSALQLVFKKDYEFKRWLKAQKDAHEPTPKPTMDEKQGRIQAAPSGSKS